MRRTLLTLLALTLCLGLLAASPAPAPAPRVVAIGDLHGDLAAAIGVFHMAGLTDAQGRWTGGSATLVQTGDITDRGADSREVIELLMRLELEAQKAGGRVIALLGNHEVMNLQGDWRYVHPDEITRFGGPEARKAAFSAQGALGRWLLAHDGVAQVGATVFAHGGVSARVAPQGVAGLNTAIRSALASKGPAAILGEEGPLWYRGYLLNDEALACTELKSALSALGARRMVVGHTTQKSGQVAQRCGGALLGVDTGISAHYGGHKAAVELKGEDAAALYPSGKIDLPDPSLR